MELSLEELHLLLFENMPQGIALFDHKINPVVCNSRFVQFCTRFSNKIIKGDKSFPEKIIDKIMSHVNDSNSTKSVFSITSSDSTVFFLIINTVQHNSKAYFQVILHPKRLNEFDMYLSLKDHYKINEKEFEVMCGMKRGLTNKSIASLLKVSEGSIKMHISRIFQKMEVANRAEMLGVLDDIA